MKILALQHVPNEPMGIIEDILMEKRIDYEYAKVYEDNQLEKSDFTHLIIMGGPMGAYQEKEYPFLREEKGLIKRAVKNGYPVLGICLGAQLIASALNADVYPYKQEIGWFKVSKTSDVLFRDLPQNMMAFQLHNDTFDLPSGSSLLYTSEEVKNQAFILRSAVGLQFHLEVTPELIKSWMRQEQSISKGKRSSIMSETSRHIKETNSNCRKLFDSFLHM